MGPIDVFLLLGVGLLGRIIYRLYFHPLSGFPGPKLAAISHLYEFYNDVIKNGTYIWEIERMHQKYGPIVRINPRELHIKDPSYYEEIYAGSSQKRDKDPKFTAVFTTPLPMVSTISHEHHRVRRGFLSNYFSKRSVRDMEPMIKAKVDQLIQRLKSTAKDGTVLPLQRVFAAFTADVVTVCCYGASHDYLKQEVFQNQMIDAINYVMSMCHINKFLPLIPKLLRIIPISLLQAAGVYMADVIAVRDLIRKQASESLQQKENGLDKIAPSPQNVFDMLASADVPPQEKTLRRLEEEGAAIFGAGTETTARALTVAMFHLISNDSMMYKLRDELKQVIPTPTTQPTWTELEQLPYLTGVVYESLRLSYGLVSRSPRVSPNNPLVYKEYVIPPGTPVSQSAYFVHRDPQIFPHPESFDPERWVRASQENQNLYKFMVAFSKGSRQCLGMNLSYAELYLALAAVTRSLDMKIVNTSQSSIEVGRDLGHPAPTTGKFELNVFVKGILTE